LNVFSVLPLCSLCLGGDLIQQTSNTEAQRTQSIHRGTKTYERRTASNIGSNRKRLMANQTKKRALLVVDVQNDFCPGGSLAVAHGDEVVPPLNKLIEEFLEHGEPVFKSRDWHPEKTKHFAAFGGTWPVHCVQNTKGAEFHPDLIDDIHIRTISKGLGDEDSYSAFDGTDLALQLHRLGVEEVWVGGLATDYCVKNTVLDGLKEGFRVKALADAMRAVEVQPGDGERAIAEMRDAGAEI
jgi:nicotinamidase/pyrazinamidase